MTDLKKFRIIAILEGISYLLLGITMYLKYVEGNGLPNSRYDIRESNSL